MSRGGQGRGCTTSAGSQAAGIVPASVPALAHHNPSVLRACRRASGLGLKDAALLIGVDWLDLQWAETGERGPTLNVDQASDLADLYNVPLALFFLPRVPRWALFKKRVRRLLGEVI